jgi:hypothetical protein
MKTNLDNTNFDHKGGDVNGNALKVQETRLKEKLKDEKNCSEFDRKKWKEELAVIKEKLKQARNVINNGQEVTKDTDPRNTFRKEERPTAVSIPKVTKGSDKSGGAKSHILTNDEAMSEGINKELSEIRYLIEYMNNNNKKQII